MMPVFVMTLGDVIGLFVLSLFIVGSAIYGIYVWINRKFCNHDWREDDRSEDGSCRGKIFIHWDCRKCGKTTKENPLSQPTTSQQEARGE